MNTLSSLKKLTKMAYDKKKVYKQSLDLIKEKKLFFVEDVVALISMSKPTFYDHFKVDSYELNTIKEALEHNRVEVKSSMRSKWYKSENATLQVALMKLIATDEEAHRLNGSKVEYKGDVTHTGDPQISFGDTSKKDASKS